jgi:hypothetical protein
LSQGIDDPLSGRLFAMPFGGAGAGCGAALLIRRSNCTVPRMDFGYWHKTYDAEE